MAKNLVWCGRGVVGFGRVPHSAGSMGARPNVSVFSRSARRRLCRYLRDCVALYRVFITLTYPSDIAPGDGRIAGGDLRSLLKRYRRRISESSEWRWSACWVREWTAAGVEHFHVLGTHYYPCAELASDWATVACRDEAYYERMVSAGTSIEKISGGRAGISQYLSKYIGKSSQKIPPQSYSNVGRYWGVEGLRDVVSAHTVYEDVRVGRERSFVILLKLRDVVSKGVLSGDIVCVEAEGYYYYRCVRDGGDLSDYFRAAILQLDYLEYEYNRGGILECP